MITLFLYLTFILFSLGQLGRVSFFNQGINIYAYEIFLLVTLTALFTCYRIIPLVTAYKKFPLVFWTLGIFLASYIINLPGYTFFQNGVALLYFLRLAMYLGYWGYLGYWVRREKKIQKHLFYAFGIFITLTIVSSLAQYFFYPDLRNLIYLGWDPHLRRLFGVFFDTSTAASIYGSMFFFVLTLGKRFMQNKGLWVFGAFGGLGILGIFLLLTFSRSAYIAFFLSLMFYLIYKKKVLFVMIFLSFFIVSFLLLPKQFGEGVGLGRTFSVYSRINDYREAIEIWKKSPLFGIGYNRIRYARSDSPRGHAASSFSSSYLIILVTGGILGLLGFLGMLGRWWLEYKKVRTPLFFLVILSFTDNIILHPFIMFLLGVMLIAAINPAFGRLQK